MIVGREIAGQALMPFDWLQKEPDLPVELLFSHDGASHYFTTQLNPVLFRFVALLPVQISKPAKTSVKYQLLANA
jgi:hypothetical protein